MSLQKRIYESTWKSTFDECHKPKLKEVIKLINEYYSSGIILDMGCGDGMISQMIEQIFKVPLIGIDISTNLVKDCRGRVEHILLCDLESPLPFRSRIINFVMALDVIEHLIDIDGFLDEVRRLLKPQGKFLIVTPNLASLVERGLLLLGFQPQNVEVSRIKKFGSIRKTLPVGHFRGFTFSALKEMLFYYGFRLEKSLSTTYYVGLMGKMDILISKIRKTWASLMIVLVKKL